MTSIPQDEVLKADRRGRVRVPAERREALLDEFEASAMSGVQFAEWAGVKYPTFAQWVHKRKRARLAVQRNDGAAGPRAQPVRLFEALSRSPGESAAGGFLSIELPGGAIARVQTPGQLVMAAELLRLLGAGGRSAC